MQKIKLWYTDFYKGFDPSNNYLQNLLSRKYELILDPENPDYLIYSCYGKDFLKYKKPIRIFYTGENLVPDFNLCDYAIGFNYLEFGDRYLRYPNFALIPDQLQKHLRSREFTAEDLEKKEYFCNFIYSNSQADPARDRFFYLLSGYKKVDSPGKHLNNTSMEVGGRLTDDWMYTKLNFQSKCQFSIAFENSSSPGYTTEKLMHAYITNTIPIYWGNPEVARDFNPQSLINCHDFSSFNEVVQRVIEVDKNERLALKYLTEPPFSQNQIPPNLKEEVLEGFLKSIFDQNLEQAVRRPAFGTTKNYEEELFKNVYSNRPGTFSSIRRILKL
jgi:hypothetical protein